MPPHYTRKFLHYTNAGFETPLQSHRIPNPVLQS